MIYCKICGDQLSLIDIQFLDPSNPYARTFVWSHITDRCDDPEPCLNTDLGKADFVMPGENSMLGCTMAKIPDFGFHWFRWNESNSIWELEV